MCTGAVFISTSHSTTRLPRQRSKRNFVAPLMKIVNSKGFAILSKPPLGTVWEQDCCTGMWHSAVSLLSFLSTMEARGRDWRTVDEESRDTTILCTARRNKHLRQGRRYCVRGGATVECWRSSRDVRSLRPENTIDAPLVKNQDAPWSSAQPNGTSIFDRGDGIV